MKYPESFSLLLESFRKLPGIGEKSAERFLYSVLEMDNDEVKDFAKNLVNCKKKVKKCEICNHLTENNICSICENNSRDSKVLCVVEEPKNVFLFEKMGNYNGKYHVLNGLISPIDGINPEDIDIKGLLRRVDKNVDEIIIALNPNINGETTSLYIKKLLEGKKIKISRLSYGIPLGTDIEYLDPLIIEKALGDRKEIS